MSTVLVKRGSYRNTPVINTRFKLVRDYQVGAKGGYVTVKNEGQFNIDIENVKVKVDNISDIEFLNGDAMSAVANIVDLKSAQSQETDQEAMDRIADRFQIMDEMTKACIAGDIRALIVTGPPGVGKSHTVVQEMEKASLFDKIALRQPRFEIVKGAVSGIGLFATLYKFSDPRNVLVFDDCDVWSDPDALNVLKGALDSGKKRRISWNKDSRLLRDEGVPNSFDFHGSIIFITNVDIANNNKRSTVKAHIDALQSRAHYLDLTIDTDRDKMLRVRQVHRDSSNGLFEDYGFSEERGDEILEFMESNRDRLREISLRMAVKIADLVKVSKNWKGLAEATCIKRG
jgi:hypothetical protein